MKLLSRFSCLSARRVPSKFISCRLKSSNLADLHFYYLPTASSQGFSRLSYFCSTLCWSARAQDLCRSAAAAAARPEAEERIARTMLRCLIKNFQLSKGGHLHTFAKRDMQISARADIASPLFSVHIKVISFIKIHPGNNSSSFLIAWFVRNLLSILYSEEK
jgi:hypothetical protein